MTSHGSYSGAYWRFWRIGRWGRSKALASSTILINWKFRAHPMQTIPEWRMEKATCMMITNTISGLFMIKFNVSYRKKVCLICRPEENDSHNGQVSTKNDSSSKNLCQLPAIWLRRWFHPILWYRHNGTWHIHIAGKHLKPYTVKKQHLRRIGEEYACEFVYML